MGEASLPIPFPEVEKDNKNLYPDIGNAIEEVFAEAFIALGGKFVFCESDDDFIENIAVLFESKGWTQMLCSDHRIYNLFKQRNLDIVLPADQYIETGDACITGCEMLVARTGSVVLSSAQNVGRTAPVFYPVHIVFAYADQIVPDIEDAFAVMKKKYKDNLPSMINLNTGPSRTADIEKTLVVGVHGPGEVFCFFINADSGYLF